MYDQEISDAEQALAGRPKQQAQQPDIEGLVKAEEERLVELAQKKEEKRRKIDEAKAKALK